jgi:cystathionine beta-lyase/cystathionine gamma-synthase
MKTGTLCVLDRGEERYNSIVTPIYLTTNYKLGEETYKKIQERKKREVYVYTRLKNPTTHALEKKMASLENGEDALAFSSGMAAITSTFLTFLKRGDELVTSMDLYGGTYSFLQNELKQHGITISYVDCTSPDEIADAMSRKTKMIFFETITNPLLKVIDIPQIAEIAHDHDCPFVVDSTFATPINQNPLEYGVDIVIHSASKYLGGHSDLIGGVTVSSQEFIEKIWEKMTRYGGCMDPQQAYRLFRSLKTLHLRMERHNENALGLARFLEAHRKVKKVLYPGLPSHSQHDLAKKLLHGFGGMVTFVLSGGDKEGLSFMHNLDICREAGSLGGVETLVSMPMNTSHSSLSREERNKLGIEEGMIRLSVGIEDVDDLQMDIASALGG